ncbi:MAG: ribonuclease HII [Proteobacteria bacterium]|nr:ribonuclease HII [Pseudomonadota bacterium]
MSIEQDQRSLFPDNGETDLFFFEQKLTRRAFKAIAGIDEAGRGPLAGPVIASAVILKLGDEIIGLTDSKKLSPKKRDSLFDEIKKRALAIGVGISEADEIDRVNILQATLLAMQRAVGNLCLRPDYLIIDGITPLPSKTPQETIKKGDSRSYSIAAASIIAKVTRDRLMVEYDTKFPQYGFAGHKGYGSKLHMEAIARHKPCPIHRKSFGGVKEHVI